MYYADLLMIKYSLVEYLSLQMIHYPSHYSMLPSNTHSFLGLTRWTPCSALSDQPLSTRTCPSTQYYILAKF